jgi:O-antigen biosynthesis protein WbqP
MRLNAPAVATHLLENSDAYITPLGRHLRRLSVDELPQLISILKGDMSFVGPRPALFNQYDLIELRTRRGVHRISPGISGWAQINGRDELPVPAKVDLDAFYLRHRSFGMDLRILALTISRVIAGKAISH